MYFFHTHRLQWLPLCSPTASPVPPSGAPCPLPARYAPLRAKSASSANAVMSAYLHHLPGSGGCNTCSVTIVKACSCLPALGILQLPGWWPICEPFGYRSVQYCPKDSIFRVLTSCRCDYTHSILAGAEQGACRQIFAGRPSRLICVSGLTQVCISAGQPPGDPRCRRVLR